MHAGKVLSIVFSCKVCHLLQNGCLCNASLNFVFIFTCTSKNLLNPLNWIAPTVLHTPPPIVPHAGGAKSYAASD
jgi:hypothetical protein